MSKDQFKKKVDENGFIEHAQFGSNFYGTSVQAVKDVAEQGRTCILDIEMEVSVCVRGCHMLFPSASGVVYKEMLRLTAL